MAEIAAKRPRQSSTNGEPVSSEKTNSSTKKNLVCTVCGADATGFNFSVITCMCCKAFFRRNALYGLEPFQCRYSTENCVINIESRRDCSYCRLKKCFQVGMKKELILTDEMKRLKREKIAQNRQMTLNSVRPAILHRSPEATASSSSPPLTAFDTSLINNINNAYEEYCRNPIKLFEQQQYDTLGQQPIKARMKLQHYYQYYQIHQNALFNFFRQVPEFEQFPADERRALGSHNLLLLIRISLVETVQDQLPLWPAINLLLESLFGKSLLEQTHQLVYHLKYDVNDSIGIRLVLMMILFSTFNTYQGTSNTLMIYRIQQKYTELFWAYMSNRYGRLIACQKISAIVRYCLQLQIIGHLAEERKRQFNLQSTLAMIE